MKAKTVLLDMMITMPLVFVLVAGLTFLYSLVAHGSGSVDWETAFRLAIILGIVLPLTARRGGGRPAQGN